MSERSRAVWEGGLEDAGDELKGGLIKGNDEADEGMEWFLKGSMKRH